MMGDDSLSTVELTVVQVTMYTVAIIYCLHVLPVLLWPKHVALTLSVDITLVKNTTLCDESCVALSTVPFEL